MAKGRPRLPSFSHELYEFYPSMSAETHKAAVTEFALGAYDRGRRDMLNAILAVNPEVALQLHRIRGEEGEFTNVHGKLPFDVVFWVCAVAEQMGIEPKEGLGA